MKKLYILLAAVLLCCLNSTQAQTLQWQQTNGPYGGDATCFAQSNTTIFVGTWGGGVYRTTNNGNSWIQENNGLTFIYMRALCVSGTSILAATTDGGIYRSTND